MSTTMSSEESSANLRLILLGALVGTAFFGAYRVFQSLGGWEWARMRGRYGLLIIFEDIRIDNIVWSIRIDDIFAILIATLVGTYIGLWVIGKVRIFSPLRGIIVGLIMIPLNVAMSVIPGILINFEYIYLIKSTILSVTQEIVIGCLLGGLVGGIIVKRKALLSSIKPTVPTINFLGFLSAIIAFLSLYLPWWTLTVDIYGISIYPWGWSEREMYVYRPQELSFIYMALAFVVIGGVLGVIGSFKVRGGKKLLIVSGIFAMLSLAIFAFGLHLFLGRTFVNVKTLFYSGPFNGGAYASCYLSFGFWLALVATILSFIAYLKYPKATQTSVGGET
jgi:hypothetical protein